MTSVCLLLSKDPIVKTCEVVAFNSEGMPIAHEKRIPLSELNQQYPGLPMRVIIPGQWCSLFQVAIPVNNEKKVRTAIPYSLEEEICQDLSELHFAFSKDSGNPGHYKVAIIDKSLLKALITSFEQHQINIHSIQCETLLLPAEHAALLDDGIIINSNQLQTKLPYSLVTQAWQGMLEKLTVLSFKNSIQLPSPLHNSKPVESEFDYQRWLAEQALKAPGVNLCQGEFILKKGRSNRYVYWYGTAITAFVALALFFSGLLAQYVKLNHQNKQLKSSIASLYKEFFPRSSQVINPQFRIRQLLQKTQRSEEPLLTLLNKLSLALKKEPGVKLERISYQNQLLRVDLLVVNFHQLEQIKSSLHLQGLKIKQQQALTSEQGIKANLDVSL